MTDKLLELLQEIGDKGYQIAIRPNPHRSGSFALLNYDDGVLCETDDPIRALRKWLDDTADVEISHSWAIDAAKEPVFAVLCNIFLDDTTDVEISYSLAPEETASDIVVGIQGAILELQRRLTTLAAETRRLENREDPFRKREALGRAKEAESDAPK